ncbi:chloride channel protein [Dongia soli]|uniref:Chloride channel protein n=1 Tax=Dongia soli TaxID=600628 RepID=A0ABU5E7U6_9PROT|nr:chloride channel protein [Dongia soli]MDY0881799.1 chloride channel protein [Dongia soli]
MTRFPRSGIPRHWLAVAYWRRKTIFLLGAALIGIAAIGFALGADEAQHAFAWLRDTYPLAAFIVTCLGFVVAAVTTAHWFPAARGSGIPQVIAARRYEDPIIRGGLIGGGVTLWKVLLTLFALLCGASVGREGPTVQLGACIMFLLGTRLGLRKPQGLVLAGAAAGIAAAFNTPLAGIMFAIEEMAKNYEKRISGLIIAAVVIAGAVSIAFLGNYKYFGSNPIEIGFSRAMIFATVCSVIAGLGGSLFSFLLLAAGRLYRRLSAGANWMPYAFPAACGLAVAIASLLTHGYANGTGYEQAKLALESGQTMPLWYGPLKLLATLASSASGLPGGLFSPSLSVGTGLGSLIAAALAHIPALGGLSPDDLRAIMLLAMAAYFAAVVQSPLTAFVIVNEMTVSNALLVPLLTATFLAAGISAMLTREPLYHALSRQF